MSNYNVKESPVLSTVPRLTFKRGAENDIIIPVTNTTSFKCSAYGPCIGLKCEEHEKGVRLHGYIPSEEEANFTINSGTVTVKVFNRGGSDKIEIPFDLV